MAAYLVLENGEIFSGEFFGTNGVMNGKITAVPPTQADRDGAKAYRVTDAVSAVSCKSVTKTGSGSRRVALLDFGAKRGIAQELATRGCEVISFPHDTSASEIMSANQPVRDTKTGRVYITSQNHGYTVIADNAAFVNVNDGTCEGLDFGCSFSVQFHPEARGGPRDTAFLFDRFTERMDAYAAR